MSSGFTSPWMTWSEPSWQTVKIPPAVLNSSGRHSAISRMWGCSEPLFEADQKDAATLEILDDLEQFLQGPCKAVETGESQAVAGPHMIDQFGQAWTFGSIT